MKTIFTLLLSLITVISFGQGPMFVHTTDAGNISADASFITHPDLDGNPSAQIVVTHTWNPPGNSGVYNENVTGVFYSTTQNQWGVYNENGNSMVTGSSYNVYIGEGPDTFLHIADLANQGSLDSYSILSHPDLNGNPDARLMITSYFNPNGIRNNHNYAVWYNDTLDRWIIFTEDLTEIPLDSAFFVAVEPSNTQTITHVADAGNISANWTAIDHPLLNNNPDAIVLFTHNWGATGDTSNVILDKTMGVWYTGSSWAIFTEDQSAMPENIEFDLLIFDPALSIEDTNIEGLTYYPNPVQNLITVRAASTIDRVTVFDILGKQVLQQSGNINNMQLNMAALTAGSYFAKVEAGESQQVIKLIKK